MEEVEHLAVEQLDALTELDGSRGRNWRSVQDRRLVVHVGS
jgi:hypothetical protein